MDKIEIKQNLVSSSKYSTKCPYKMIPEYICIHNTANDASAKSEIEYMVNNSNQTSFHIAVDDVEVWQGLPLDRNGWHAGDGKLGIGNRKTIGIEICYSKSGGTKFDKAEDLAAKLVAQLLKERNWGSDKVKKHQDFSGKYCPARTLDKGWDRFISLINNYLKDDMSTELLFKKKLSDENWAILSEFEKLKSLKLIGRNDSIQTQLQKWIEINKTQSEELKMLRESCEAYLDQIAKLEAKILELENKEEKPDMFDTFIAYLKNIWAKS